LKTGDQWEQLPVLSLFSEKALIWQSRGKWHGLLTTDTDLAFERAYKIYSTRWAIEVYFYAKHIVMQSATGKLYKKQGVPSLTLQYHFA